MSCFGIWNIIIEIIENLTLYDANNLKMPDSFLLITSRYKEEEEEQSSYSALDHIHRFSDMRKLEESELSDGDEDDGSFGSPSLTEAVKPPLFRKSKSQVKQILTIYQHILPCISSVYVSEFKHAG